VYKIVPISKYPVDSVRHTNIDFVCRDERGVEMVVGADAELTHALSMVMENADVPTPELGEGITLRICVSAIGNIHEMDCDADRFGRSRRSARSTLM
jgi:hypothetical protein